MNPELAVKLILEQDDDFDAAEYVKSGGDESAIPVYDGPVVRIVIPLTVHTLNDYFNGQWDQTVFQDAVKGGPLYAIRDHTSDDTMVLQFETRSAFNGDGVQITWNDRKEILKPQALDDAQNGLIQYFQAQIAAKKNARQAVANLVHLGRPDLAVSYGRHIGHVKLSAGKAIEVALAAKKAGVRMRSKATRFMQGQENVEWGKKGIYLLFDDWVDTAPFFGRDNRHNYEDTAEKIFNGDTQGWFDANVSFRDAWYYVDAKNENLIRQLLTGRVCLNDDDEEFVVMKEDVYDLNNKEIEALISKNEDDATEDIATAVSRAGDYAEESAKEGAYLTGYQSALLSAFGQDEAVWKQYPDGKGGKKHKLAIFVPYNILELWLDRWKEDNDDEFDGQIIDLAYEYVEKAVPNDDYYDGPDKDYFNETLGENLAEIDMVQPDRSDPVQPELPLEGEPAPAQIEPERTALVQVGEHPNEKVYKNIPHADAEKYTKIVPNTTMRAESIVTSLLEAPGDEEEDDPKEFLGRHQLLMYPQPDEVEYTIEIEPEDIPYEGHFSSGDEISDANLMAWIGNELERGNQWAWCSAKVIAAWTDPDDDVTYAGADSLGGCSYQSEKDFCQDDGYFPGMKHEAYARLISNIKKSRAVDEALVGEAVTGATRETVNAILAQIKEIALATGNVNDFKRVATERLAQYSIQFEPYQGMPAVTPNFPGAASADGIYLRPPDQFSPHAIERYVRLVSRVLYHEIIHSDQIARSGNPEEMQASAERMILGKGGNLDLHGYTRQKQEMMAHAGTLIDDWREANLTPDKMRDRLRTGAWDSGVGHSALKRSDPKLYNLFLKYASEYIDRIAASTVQENEESEDPKEFVGRHPDLNKVRVHRISYHYGRQGQRTVSSEDDTEVPAEEAVNRLSGEYVTITWPDGYSETLDFAHMPMRVSGDWQGSRLGYLTLRDGRRELVKMSRLPNVAYGYSRPIRITQQERDTFQPLQDESALQEAVYKLSTTQINLPEDIANHIISWGKLNIPDDAVYADEDGGKGRENEGHITVLFGLTDSEPPAALGEIVAKTKPFMIELAGVSIFEAPEYDVVKIDVISEELTNLSNEIRATCPNENTFKVYRPHVTIAYTKPGTCRHLIGKDVFENFGKA